MCENQGELYLRLPVQIFNLSQQIRLLLLRLLFQLANGFHEFLRLVLQYNSLNMLERVRIHLSDVVCIPSCQLLA